MKRRRRPFGRRKPATTPSAISNRKRYAARQSARVRSRSKSKERVAEGLDILAEKTSMLCGVHGLVPVCRVKRDQITLVCGCVRQIRRPEYRFSGTINSKQTLDRADLSCDLALPCWVVQGCRKRDMYGYRFDDGVRSSDL